MALAVLAAAPARATHERAALITWAPVVGTPNTVEFTVTGAWRRSAYSTSNGRCRNWSAGGFPSMPCSGGDGFPAVGDVIVESQGDTFFNPGQGSLIGSPAGALAYLVTSIDVTNDWLYGTAIDPTALPAALDTTILKTYTNGSQRTAFIEDCCRVSNDPGGNQHINNPDKNYRIETRVNPSSGNRPPVSTMPPVVFCPVNGLCAFSIPASDPDNDTMTFRFATAAEASGSAANFVQPGPPQAPNAAAIDTATGLYTWNTTGATIGSPGSTTYYSTQVVVEDRDGSNQVKSRIALDFLIQLVAQVGSPPVFDHGPTPACGTVFNVAPDDAVSFLVQASDGDFGQNVTLNATGLPPGATMTPTLPTVANPVSSTFSWTPGGGQAGTSHLINFTAIDSASLQAQCAITINVSQCTSNAHCNDGNFCTTDVCDPMHPNANAGGCVNSAVTCDACQTCNPGLGCTGVPCTPMFSPTITATPTETATPTPTATDTQAPTATATETPEPFCGDGTVDPGETCDDGNMLNGDGCETDCTPSSACSFVYPGTERFVGGCDTPSFADIQSAIDASADGDVVTVCAGTYTQPVVVSRQIKLQAAAGGGAVIHTATTAIDIRRSGVQIDGLTVQADSGAAITADSICPLFQASCGPPGNGSNVTITNNTILSSPVGIGWQRRIDCATITDNTLDANGAHIQLQQQEGPPATLVSIINNTITGGGASGAAVSLSAINVLFAANTVDGAADDGLVIANIPPASSQVLENDIKNNGGDGIAVLPGGETVPIHDNNIRDNLGSGLANETAGTVDATVNWWDSQTGPSGVTWPNPAPGPALTGVGDLIVNRNGGTTLFIEFLCRPFPEGFPSALGVCGTETAELRQLLPGRAPDLDTFGRYIVFESAANLDVDPRTDLVNVDGSNEIFLLNRRPKKKLGGKCLGGLNPCDFTNPGSCPTCAGRKSCPGDPSADPIVLNGQCVQVTQLSSGGSGTDSRGPRLTGLAKNIIFSSTTDPTSENPDGSREIMRWSRPAFEKAPSPVALSTPAALLTDDLPPMSYDVPAPALNSKSVVMESNANPPGANNADGNTEIFVFKPRSGDWIQLTDTTAPVDNRRPATVKGKRIIFDSTGDLTGGNPDGNREIFIARLRGGGNVELTQLTDTLPPAENRAGSMDSNSALFAFTSTADLLGENPDGNREIFTWHRRHNLFDQVTHSVGGENANPVVNYSQRFLVFESTADDPDITAGPPGDGAINRRIWQYDRVKNQFLLLSRSRFGTNQAPRIRKRRYVVWESTADLTGNNPNNEWVIYIFDRKKDPK